MTAPTMIRKASRASVPCPGPSAAAECEWTGDRALIVRLSGTWKLGAARPEAQALTAALLALPNRVVFTADEALVWDTALLTWLRAAVQACDAVGVPSDRSKLPGGIAQLLHLSEIVVEPPRPVERRPVNWLARVGGKAARMGLEAVEAFAFVGRIVLALGRFVAMRAQFRRADLYRLLQSSGAEAVPIVTLVSVIIGMILAFVGSVQLRLFGADLYIANMVGIGMVREMGAIVVGVIMAGRTGAAFAAQLGTMKVTEEIDALTTFGISPIDQLVLPRLIALTVMLPILCLYSIGLGICGGAIVGVGLLGISRQLYFDQTVQALTLADLYGGLFRSFVFGILIAVTCCLRGMRCGGDAAAVGEATTGAVVASMVAIVVADGVIAVSFNAFGL